MYCPTKDEFKEMAKEGNLIPVYREILADLETPVSSFRKIATSEHAYLLESVEGGEKWAEFSFLGINPSLIFKCHGDRVEIVRGGKVERRTSTSPLDLLRELVEGFKPISLPGLPRFYGGAVGYLGYDMVRFFETLPEKREGGLGIPDSIFIFADTILIFDNLRHTIKVISNIPSEGDPDIAYDKAVERIDEVIRRLRKPAEGGIEEGRKGGRREIESNFTKELFEEKVRIAKEYIRAGDIIQVVLSQRLKTKIGCDPFDIYRALRTINPSPYMYYLKLGDLNIVGSSPEVLVRAEKGMVELRPIAGTRPR